MLRCAFALLLASSSGLAHADGARPLPLSDKAWEFDTPGARVVSDGARDVLEVGTGFGYRRDVRLENGTIDFDVQLTRKRSFVYVAFRMQSDDEREEFYLRPHKSELPDAVQYAPVWQGRSGWQLYHGPGRTAAVNFDPGVWTRVRVVLRGRQAALFVNDMQKPVVVVPRLGREPRPGYIAIGAFNPVDPFGKAGGVVVARFANVTIAPDEVPFDFAAASAPASAAHTAADAGGDVVRTWAVSRAFVPRDEAAPALPSSDVAGEFQAIQTEPGGLLELHRHVPIPANTRTIAAVVRVHVRAARAGRYTFDLGFSDIATVFVNGEPVFRGEGSYSFDTPRREGLIGYDQARLYLPLAAGDNELTILVSDSFGGWGAMGRFVGAEGLTFEAR